jgi:hypothetical protein
MANFTKKDHALTRAVEENAQFPIFGVNGQNANVELGNLWQAPKK